MNFSRKYLVFNIVFLLGILWCYNSYFQQTRFSSLMELSSENNTSSNFIDIDTEIQDIEQIIFAYAFLPLSKNTSSKYNSQSTQQFTQPCFTVWQPPKLT